jgi:hypothetical protein
MSKVCLNHPDREATDRCVACFKPLCDECAISFQGDTYCSEECRDNALRTGANIADFKAAEKAARRKRLIKKLIVFVVLAAVAAAAAVYIMRDKKLSEKLGGDFEKIKKGTMETVDDLKK